MCWSYWGKYNDVWNLEKGKSTKSKVLENENLKKHDCMSDKCRTSKVFQKKWILKKMDTIISF